MTAKKNIEIVNKKATFEFHFLQRFEAGISLTGTEVKSIRLGNANLKDAYCSFTGSELFVRNLFISEYKFGNIFNHESRRDRKLLLRKSELSKLDKKVKEKGFTIIPYRIFLNERGFIKIEIALAQGKKSFDKRISIKEKDLQRDMDRHKK